MCDGTTRAAMGIRQFHRSRPTRCLPDLRTTRLGRERSRLSVKHLLRSGGEPYPRLLEAVSAADREKLTGLYR